MQEIGCNFAARCNFNLDLDIDLGINSNVRPLSPLAFGQQQQHGKNDQGWAITGGRGHQLLLSHKPRWEDSYISVGFQTTR